METYTQTVPVGTHVVTIDREEDRDGAERYALRIDDNVRGVIVRLPGTGRRWRLRSLPGHDAADDLPGFWREDGQVALFIKLAKEAVAHFREGRMRSADETTGESVPAATGPHVRANETVELLQDIVKAWDMRPPGDHASPDMRQWIDATMAPAIDKARAGLARP